MTRVRNFSDWAYWRVHLETVVASDPCPVDDPAGFEAWRARTRARVLDLLGPSHVRSSP